ncbi:hypothetical protein PIROE2DRAFT_35011, partial [Piromyces sp. E2]
IAKQNYEIIIPSYAAWFSFSDIHETEKKALPEFFNNKNKSKTPTIYKEYRDFIINTYRLNPSEYLTVTACIIFIFFFVEDVNPDTIPNHMAPHLAGNYRLNMSSSLIHTPPMNNPNTINNQMNPHQLPQPQQNQINTLNNSIKHELDSNIHKNVYHSTAGENNIVKLQNGNLINYCQSCQKEFSKYQYVNHKIRNYVICSNCFYEGKYPMTMQSGDFFKIVNKNYQKDLKDIENEWTDQETLLLLEGLDMYDDDWSKIADHVKTKTQDQCILRFLQLPIEDPYLGIPQKDLGGLQYQDGPLNQTENPVMSIVAFLTSVVNPGVASAAANAALKELGKEIEKKDIQEQDLEQQEIISKQALQKAAAAALAAAAAKAKVLAVYEEREIRHLVNELIELQLKKLEMKMNQFDKLEVVLEAERNELKKKQQELYAEQVALKKQMLTSNIEFKPLLAVSNQE